VSRSADGDVLPFARPTTDQVGWIAVKKMLRFFPQKQTSRKQLHCPPPPPPGALQLSVTTVPAAASGFSIDLQTVFLWRFRAALEGA
jgi:hypothetical protein